MQTHLESATVFKGFSPDIQNDLIDSVGIVVLVQIKQNSKNVCMSQYCWMKHQMLVVTLSCPRSYVMSIQMEQSVKVLSDFLM